MKSNINRNPDGTASITITTTPEEGQAAKTKALEKFTPKITIPGFRAGKAPLGLVEQQVRTEKLVEETLSNLIEDVYLQALDQYKLEPIARPTVSIPDLRKNENNKEIPNYFDPIWPKMIEKGIKIKINAYTTPDMELGQWENMVSEIKFGPKIETAKTLKEAGKKASQEKKKKQEKVDAALTKTPAELNYELENHILDTLVEKIQFDLPKELIRRETQNQLLRHIETVQKLGISYADYLKSQNKKPQDTEKEIALEAEKNLRIRLILSQIAKATEKELGSDATLQDVINYLKNLGYNV